MPNLILFALLALPGKVTMTCGATPVKDVVAALKEKTGMSLAVSNKLETQFLALRLSDAPVSECLDRLAKSLGAKWVDISGTRTLMADPGAKGTALDSAWSLAVHKYLDGDTVSHEWTAVDAEEIVRRGVRIEDQGPETPSSQKRADDLSSQDPSQRFARHLARIIGEKTLVGLPLNKRIVFALDPTRMQRQLPRESTAALDQFLRESRLQNAALEKRGINDQTPSSDETVAVTHWAWVADKKFERMDVTLKKSRWNIQMEIALVATDSQGTIGVSSILQLPDFAAYTAPDSRLNVEGEFKPSEESNLIGKAYSWRGSEARGDHGLTERERQQLVRTFSDLEKYELLSFAPSEIVLQTAEAMGKNTIVALNDGMISAFGFPRFIPSSRLADFYNGAWPAWSARTEGNWLEIETDGPRSDSWFRLPRKALGAFVREVYGHGVTLDNVADLIAQTTNDDQARMLRSLASLPIPGQELESFRTDSFDVLRAYGRLDQASRGKARNGGFTTQFGALPANLQAAVSDLLYEGVQTLSLRPPNRDDEFLEVESLNMSRDTTNLFPNGVPSDVAVMFLVRGLDTLFMVNRHQGHDSTPQIVKEDEAASQMAWQEKVANAHGASYSAKFAYQKVTQLDMLVTVASGGAHGRYRFQPRLTSQQLVDIDGLPDDLRKSLTSKVDQKRSEIRNLRLDEAPPRIKP